MSTLSQYTPELTRFEAQFLSQKVPSTPEIDKRNAAYQSGEFDLIDQFAKWLVGEEILYLDRPETARELVLDFLGIDESKVAEELLLLHEFRQNIEKRRVK